MTLKILYIGGVKSGKSRLAERRALALAADRSTPSKPFYLATADPSDRSLDDRIQRHRQDRGDQFITLEEPFHLQDAIEAALNIHQIVPGAGVILIDCLTLWLSNLLLQEMYRDPNATPDFSAVIPLISQTIAGLISMPQTLIFVINDVGSGIHADTAIGRQFTDLSGLMAQQVAAGCHEVYHCIAGIGNRIR